MTGSVTSAFAVLPSGLTTRDLAVMLADLRERAVKDKSYRQTPIGAAAGRYLDTLAFDNYSPNTLTNREQTLAWLALDHPTLEPRDVTHDLLRAFLEANWRDAARNTKAQHVSSVKNFFRWAHDHDLISADPARKLRGPRAQDSERRAHDLDTIRTLLVAQDQRRDRIAILLLYWCALRRNELRLVQFRHVDLARRVLTVFGKGGRVLEQNVPGQVALDLERYILDEQPAPNDFLLHPQKIGRRGRWPNYADEIVWSDRGRPLTVSGIDKWWQRAVRRAGLDHFPMHEMRHTAGTHFHEAGRDLVATQHFMRHKSAATTERVYLHVDRVRHVAEVQRGMADPLGGTETE